MRIFVVAILCLMVPVTLAEDYLIQVLDSNNKEIGYLTASEGNDADYVLLEEISKVFNGTRKYEPLTKRLTLNIENNTVVFTIDQQNVKVNGNDYSLSRQAILVSGKAAVPTDFLSNILPYILKRRVALDLEEGTLKVGKRFSQNGTDESPQARIRIFRVIIDPGHGGYDVGAKSKTGLFEKDLSLSVALKMNEFLREREDVRVYLTRDEDKYMTPEERVRFANDLRGDVLIGIHFNWSPSQNSKGFNLCSYSDKIRINTDLNFALSGIAESEDYLSKSRKLANEIKGKITGVITTGGRYREAPLAAMSGLFMPAVLVEVLHLSNSDDLDILSRAGFIDSLSMALCDSVLSYGPGMDSP